MAPLIRWAAELCVLAVPFTRACALSPVIAPWQPIVTEASLRFGVPEAWIERVILAESGGHTTLGGRPIRSRTGAMGLMQLMPGTWSDMRDAWHLGVDPDDPHDNILAGTAYLRAMYDRFGYPGMFAAYNAGPARYATALATGNAASRRDFGLSGDGHGDVAIPIPAASSGCDADALRGSCRKRWGRAVRSERRAC